MDFAGRTIPDQRDRSVQAVVDTESVEAVRCYLRSGERGMCQDDDSDVGSRDGIEQYSWGGVVVVVVGRPAEAKEGDAANAQTNVSSMFMTFVHSL